MTHPSLKTVVFGFGKVGADYARDRTMARHFSYATHAQVLAEHPAFDWQAVVDVSEKALDSARRDWNVPFTVKSIEDLSRYCEPEIAVIATPPGFRTQIIENIPSLRAVLVEKPLGVTVAEGMKFLEECRRRNILVQVNLWRRADDGYRRLAGRRFQEYTGRPQAVFGIYGNGMLNNGTHMVDFVRMLLGEIESVQGVCGFHAYSAGPIEGDMQAPFTMKIRGGPAVMMQPLRFDHYRENALDIWGEKARLSIMQEGVRMNLFPKAPNRAMEGEFEIDSDHPMSIESTVGNAFYRMYDNLTSAIFEGEPLCSPGSSALETERVLDAILESVRRNGEPIVLV